MVKICNQLVKKVKKYRVPDRNQGRVARHNSCKGPNLSQKRTKGPNEYFGASKCYFGPNFWNFAPKGPTWQPCTWIILSSAATGFLAKISRFTKKIH